MSLMFSFTYIANTRIVYQYIHKNICSRIFSSSSLRMIPLVSLCYTPNQLNAAYPPCSYLDMMITSPRNSFTISILTLE